MKCQDTAQGLGDFIRMAGVGVANSRLGPVYLNASIQVGPLLAQKVRNLVDFLYLARNL